jgi:hypothetical protein
MATLAIGNLRKVVLHDAASAATTTLNGSIVCDTQGADGITVIAALGDVTTGSVLGLQVQHGDSNSTTGMTDITGASVGFTAGASNADLKLLQVNVGKLTKRYVRVVITRGTANAVLNGVFGILHGQGREFDGTQGDVIATTTI